MATAVVEMTYDRRTGERRKQGEGVNPERRRVDRRQHGVGDEFARVGWARVQIE